jgi:hypothetical protein
VRMALSPGETPTIPSKPGGEETLLGSRCVLGHTLGGVGRLLLLFLAFLLLGVYFLLQLL